ncbi:dinitrogenase iron-molybdenum cofactor [Archaeoglobales archaeon]|nr:MAG: dinitrogenase iron-molybdenum cofactor [Archaeoglobales archaeon]
MRVAIPCIDDRGLDSYVSQHFGRARYFVIADVDNGVKDVKVVRLPFEDHMPGDIPRFLQSLGVEVVITYGLGMRAMGFFESMGIRVVSGAMGKVGDVLDGFIKNSLVLDKDWRSKEEFSGHHCD